MPIKRPQLVNGGIYHIVIRAVAGSKLFRGKRDYLRMKHNLLEFNDENPTSWEYRRKSENSSRTQQYKKRKRERVILVEILAFCLMPNHVHLLVRQVREGGISKFMRKIGAGYAGYYNKKYDRKGHVFQGRYRIVHIKNQKQLKTVFVYIHANPVSIIFPNWKEKGIEDFQKAKRFIEDYQWSSYAAYLGRVHLLFLADMEFLTKVMGGVDGCRDFVEAWLQFKKELVDFKWVAIE